MEFDIFGVFTALLIIATVTGKAPGLGSSVFVAVYKDAVLPCHSKIPINLSRDTLDWARVDVRPELTLYARRDGHELESEKWHTYKTRTAIMGDGSVKLQKVERGDNGTYKCNVISQSLGKDEVFVSLFVVVLADINITVQPTSSNQLSVQCESRGWSPKPAIDLLNAMGDVLPSQKVGPSMGLDQLYSCSAHTDVTAVEVNGTVICRVHIPGSDLAKEQSVSVSVPAPSTAETPSKYWLLLLIVVIIVIIILKLKMLRSAVQKTVRYFIDYLFGMWQDVGRYKAHGDILKMKTTGASALTERGNINDLIVNGQLLTGVDASRELARKDQAEMVKYREDMSRVGESHGVHPALIAAIVSRQSRAGALLDPSGFGTSDPNSFGLMQINKFYHELKGSSHSKEHLNQGVILLVKLIEAMCRVKPTWTREQQLKGALACYIAGEDRVLQLTDPEEVDSVTPYMDFSSDVLARAHWFAGNGF